ncbi:hypothetical protein ABCR94_22845 [Streptomyces sp. 21So2-11]|uniref:hypothetical protein n=1 Tax=Streptomyces sp. 21So2-11 TaxID=3144408 RepID=UPI0032196A2B
MSTPPPPGTAIPPLAGGVDGPTALRPLLATVLDALHEGAVARGGPLPPGGTAAVAKRLRDTVGPVIPTHGTGAQEALYTLVRARVDGRLWLKATLLNPHTTTSDLEALLNAPLNPLRTHP